MRNDTTLRAIVRTMWRESRVESRMIVSPKEDFGIFFMDWGADQPFDRYFARVDRTEAKSAIVARILRRAAIFRRTGYPRLAHGRISLARLVNGWKS